MVIKIITTIRFVRKRTKTESKQEISSLQKTILDNLVLNGSVKIAKHIIPKIKTNA